MWSRLPWLDAFSAPTSSQRPSVKRICWLTIANMYKIVEDPAAIIPVIPKLEPFGKGIVWYGQQRSRTFLSLCFESCPDDCQRQRVREEIGSLIFWYRIWSRPPCLRCFQCFQVDLKFLYSILRNAFLTAELPWGWESILGTLGAAVCQCRGASLLCKTFRKTKFGRAAKLALSTRTPSTKFGRVAKLALRRHPF